MFVCRQALLVGLCTLAATAVGAQSGMHHQEQPEESPILASYDFEQPTPSGPDTFWARQRDGSVVSLSTAFRVSGERSLHISEVPGNRDFAEFLAYFRNRDEGKVYIQFYLLLTDPEQRFNFGLAGPAWFLSPKQDGHAIWLQTDNGVFRHRPNEGWEQLFAPRPFAWHFIDIVYDVADGTYDLRILEEGLDEPLVDLHDATGTNGHADSAVKYFSLIGDLEDAGRFDFFVDDLLIATTPAVRQRPFVAPGRRTWFVEIYGAQTVDRSDNAWSDLLWEAQGWMDSLAAGPDADLAPRLEEVADEAFLAGFVDFAGIAYERLLENEEHGTRLLLKLADVRYQQGRIEAERELRESIYGRLGVEAE